MNETSIEIKYNEKDVGYIWMKLVYINSLGADNQERKPVDWNVLGSYIVSTYIFSCVMSYISSLII